MWYASLLVFTIYTLFNSSKGNIQNIEPFIGGDLRYTNTTTQNNSRKEDYADYEDTDYDKALRRYGHDPNFTEPTVDPFILELLNDTTPTLNYDLYYTETIALETTPGGYHGEWFLHEVKLRPGVVWSTTEANDFFVHDYFTSFLSTHPAPFFSFKFPKKTTYKPIKMKFDRKAHGYRSSNNTTERAISSSNRSTISPHTLTTAATKIILDKTVNVTPISFNNTPTTEVLNQENVDQSTTTVPPIYTLQRPNTNVHQEYTTRATTIPTGSRTAKIKNKLVNISHTSSGPPVHTLRRPDSRYGPDSLKPWNYYRNPNKQYAETTESTVTESLTTASRHSHSPTPSQGPKTCYSYKDIDKAGNGYMNYESDNVTTESATVTPCMHDTRIRSDAFRPESLRRLKEYYYSTNKSSFGESEASSSANTHTSNVTEYSPDSGTQSVAFSGDDKPYSNITTISSNHFRQTDRKQSVFLQKESERSKWQFHNLHYKIAPSRSVFCRVTSKTLREKAASLDRQTTKRCQESNSSTTELSSTPEIYSREWWAEFYGRYFNQSFTTTPRTYDANFTVNPTDEAFTIYSERKLHPYQLKPWNMFLLPRKRQPHPSPPLPDWAIPKE